MKRWWIAALIATLPLMAFAQDKPDHPGFPPRLDWKAGTSVTAEYKELTGTVEGGKVLTVKAGDIVYWLAVGKKEPGVDTFKTGASVAMKGIATKIVEAGQADRYLYRPLEATADGKTVTFKPRLDFGGPRPGPRPDAPAPAN